MLPVLDCFVSELRRFPMPPSGGVWMVSFGFSALGASVVDNMSRRAVDCISATNATYAARHADLTARHSTHSMCGIHVEEDIAKPEN